MSLTARDLVGRLGLPANDPAVLRAVNAAYAWACDVFRVDDPEELDLDENQLGAVAGYARDFKKLEKASFGYFATDNEIPAAIGNISRRWRPMLIGERSFGFA